MNREISTENLKGKINNEDKVIELLEEKGKYLYGDIIKDLHFSYTKGQEVIFSLISKGIIEHCNKSSKLQLRVEN